jgi:hypothetical protein
MRVVVVTVVVVAFACRGDALENSPRATVQPPPASTISPSASSSKMPSAGSTSEPVPQASATAAPKATVELPATGFRLADVLGKTKRDVDRALGHGDQLEDGPWQYDGFGKVGLLVVFEAGHAVFVAVQAPEFHNSDADRAAVLAWMQTPNDVDFDRTHNFDFELGVWTAGAQDRQLARRALAVTVTEGLKSSLGGYASANYTWLEVSLRDPDTCTRASLGRIAKTYDLKSAGFDVMECLNDAGTKLSLH